MLFFQSFFSSFTCHFLFFLIFVWLIFVANIPPTFRYAPNPNMFGQIAKVWQHRNLDRKKKRCINYFLRNVLTTIKASFSICRPWTYVRKPLVKFGIESQPRRLIMGKNLRSLNNALSSFNILLQTAGRNFRFLVCRKIISIIM